MSFAYIYTFNSNRFISIQWAVEWMRCQFSLRSLDCYCERVCVCLCSSQNPKLAVNTHFANHDAVAPTSSSSSFFLCCLFLYLLCAAVFVTIQEISFYEYHFMLNWRRKSFCKIQENPPQVREIESMGSKTIDNNAEKFKLMVCAFIGY